MGLYENGSLTADLVDSNRNHYCHHQIWGYHGFRPTYVQCIYMCVYDIHTLRAKQNELGQSDGSKTISQSW